jgi:hypothetical protein
MPLILLYYAMVQLYRCEKLVALSSFNERSRLSPNARSNDTIGTLRSGAGGDGQV